MHINWTLCSCILCIVIFICIICLLLFNFRIFDSRVRGGMACDDIITGFRDDRWGYLSIIVAYSDGDDITLLDGSQPPATLVKVGIVTGTTLKPIQINDAIMPNDRWQISFNTQDGVGAIGPVKTISKDGGAVPSNNPESLLCPELYHDSLRNIVERDVDLKDGGVSHLCLYWCFPPNTMIGYAELLIRGFVQERLAILAQNNLDAQRTKGINVPDNVFTLADHTADLISTLNAINIETTQLSQLINQAAAKYRRSAENNRSSQRTKAAAEFTARFAAQVNEFAQVVALIAKGASSIMDNPIINVQVLVDHIYAITTPLKTCAENLKGFLEAYNEDNELFQRIQIIRDTIMRARDIANRLFIITDAVIGIADDIKRNGITITEETDVLVNQLICDFATRLTINAGFFTGDSLKRDEHAALYNEQPSSCTGIGSSEIFVIPYSNISDVNALAIHNAILQQIEKSISVVDQTFIDFNETGNWPPLNPNFINIRTILDSIEETAVKYERLMYVGSMIKS